ncbi:MAG: CpsD/CapB family tyrosine-protein kinase [Acidimicrobiia bacterium]|nr:CpsD/CapB family tyrosine-protein kinase [Acidimicrobiia bacterium]
MLRSNLDVAVSELDNPCIVITSAAEGEGKTSTCVALAQSLAATGSKVVLVDLDLRDPDAHEVIGGHNDVGVSDVLLGRCGVEECLQRVTLDSGEGMPPSGLFFLAAGPRVANPTELLSEARLAQALDGLAAVADIVFLDTPPVLAVADSLVIGRLAAGAVLVVQAGVTPAPLVKRAKEALERNQVGLLGVVLNQFDPRFAAEAFDVGLGYGSYGRAEPLAVAAVPGSRPGSRKTARVARRWIGPAIAMLLVAAALGIGISVAARADDGHHVDGTAPTSTSTSTTTSPTTTRPSGATVVRSGRGDATVPIARPDGSDRPTIVYATHEGSRFSISDGSDQLVDSTGAYQGSTLLPPDGTGSLRVRADGAWHIEFRSPQKARAWDGAAKLGRGDQVLVYRGPAANLALRHAGSGSFLVRVVSLAGGAPRRLAAATGDYSGTTRIGAGPLALAIQADDAVWGATASA